MINYHETLIETLSTILPTYYQRLLTSEIEMPCISYYERNNYAVAKGDTMQYTRISYNVNVFSRSVEDMQKYSLQVETALRSKGFTLTSSNEYYDITNSIMYKQLIFEALAVENFEE